MVTKLANYDAPCVVLGKDRLWWIFLLSSLCTPFILAALTMIIRLMIRIHHNRKFFVDRNAKIDKTTTFTYFYEEFEVEWVTAIRDAADTLVSTRFRAGQIMAITSFVLSMCSLIIYYNTVSFFIKDVEQCQLFTNNVHQQADFAFNVFFLLYYLLRFAAAEEKITFLFNIWSIVDYFTVPPAFVGLALDRDWIGLKFLRVLYLRRIPNILWALGVMNSPAKIKLTQLGLTWIAILLAAGGMFHLVENSGDPFYPDYDGQRVTYWDFCYFAFGTMATLGSADINVKTILGKLTNVFLVFIVLMLIAFAVPEVLDLLGEREKHNGYHRKVHNEKHVVICGYITFDSVAEVFAEFFHPDRDIRDIKLICLDEGRPSMDFEAFLKKYKFQVGYLRGHIMNPTDLHRAKVHEADACLILANKTTNNAETEDTNNIMRVVALKNYHPKLRIIVQLLQYRSKSYLTSIPNWDPSVGDDVICLPEIKLGLLAQNCVAPGFATMMANIFAARASNLSDALPDWLNQYLSGAGMEMYPQTLSDTFSGLKFHELVEICYEKLNLLLLAVSNVPDENSSFFSLQFILNPPVGFRIQKGMTGCFIAESVNDAQRVSYYCRFCHDDIKTPDLIKPCECEGRGEEDGFDHQRKRSEKRPNKFGLSMRLEVPKEFDGAKNSVANAMTSRSNQHSTSPENVPDALSLTSTELEHLDMAKQEELEQKYFSSFEKKIVYYMRNFGSLANWTNLVDGGAIMYDEEGFPITLTDEPRFDSTGMFWWCPPRRFEDVAMDRFQASKKNYKNHIVLVVFAGEDSSVIGLNNFVMPLRSSNKPFDELRDIVIIGDPRFLALEWMNLMNFPKMHLLKVNGLSRSDLRAANIHISEMCLLLTATSGSHSDQDSVLMDKDPILTSLTIKAMNFGLSEDSLSDAPIIFSTESKKRNGQVPNGALSALVFKQSLVKVSKIGKPIAKEDKRVIPGATVPLLTELIHDSNVQFVEQDDIDRNEFFMSEPFACGNTFATTVLQSLLVTTYFNPFMLSIMRALIFGGITPEFEQILSEGAGLIGGPNLSDRYAFTDRSLMEQISIQDPRFVRHANGKYGTLFLDALRHHSIICLGLYRKIAPNDRGPRSLRRYCITHPSKDLLLQPHDRIFVIGRVLDKHHA